MGGGEGGASYKKRDKGIMVYNINPPPHPNSTVILPELYIIVTSVHQRIPCHATKISHPHLSNIPSPRNVGETNISLIKRHFSPPPPPPPR